MAACSGSTPIGRPSPGRAYRLAEFGERAVAAPGQLRGAGQRSPRRPASTRRTACSSTLGCRSNQLADTRPRLQLPRRGPARHALRHLARRPASAARERTRASASCATSFASTARSPTRRALPGRSSSAVVRRPSKPRPTLPPWSSRPRPLRCADGAASIRRRACSRRCASTSIASSRCCRARSRRAVDVLRPGGRLAVISYHSLEDRIVKRFIASERRGCTCPPELPVCVCGRSPRLAPLGKQPQRPSAAEVARNPRSRSALLRSARRLAA